MTVLDFTACLVLLHDVMMDERTCVLKLFYWYHLFLLVTVVVCKLFSFVITGTVDLVSVSQLCLFFCDVKSLQTSATITAHGCCVAWAPTVFFKGLAY